MRDCRIPLALVLVSTYTLTHIPFFILQQLNFISCSIMLHYIHKHQPTIVPIHHKNPTPEKKMNHPYNLPVHRVNNGHQPYYGRHHSVRYFAHRVKESLATRVAKFICTIFLFIFFVVGLIAFILWLNFRPHRPRFHLEEFSMPSLAQPTLPPEGPVILFNVSIRNSNQKVTVHYDSIECAVYYRDDPIGGSPLVTESFDQETKNTTILYKQLSGPTLTVNNQHWTDMQRDRQTGSVPFRLEITSVTKFHIFSHVFSKDTKKHKMHVKCPAVVDANGLLLPGYNNRRCDMYFT